MCYMAHELALNPDVQEKLREEVDRYMEEGNGLILYEALVKMKYMEMVTLQTLSKISSDGFHQQVVRESSNCLQRNPVTSI